MSSRTDGHTTTAIQVWADVDVGIADLVLYLNTIPGVRTDASCQGSIGDGGAAPYGPYVMAHWDPECFARLATEFDVEILGEAWGYIRPRQDRGA
jgi:hypothetical protein